MKSIALAAAFLCLAPSAVTRAQSPFAGHYVVSSFKTDLAPKPIGDGGVFFVHPGTGIVTPITGLPASLTGAGKTSGRWGASCVTRNPLDGTLVVGEVVSTASTLHFHILTLDGSKVTNVRSVPLGPTATYGDVAQAAVLPNGDILFTVYGILSGQLLNVEIARFSPQSNTISVVARDNHYQGTAFGLTTDAAGSNAFVGVFNTFTKGEVWRIPLGSGKASRIAQFPGGVHNLARDASGQLIVGIWSVGLPTRPSVYRVDPTTGKTTPLLYGGGAQAVAVERATGALVLTANSSCDKQQRNGITWMSPNGGTPRRITCGPTAGWGLISGLDVYHNPETYGASTPVAGRYVWDVAPNPGGLPTLGNASFGLRLVTNGHSPALSALFWSTGRDNNLWIGPVQILLDTTRWGGPASFAASGTTTIYLPIPASGGLTGVPIHFQSLHLHGGVLAASNGVSVTPF